MLEYVAGYVCERKEDREEAAYIAREGERET